MDTVERHQVTIKNICTVDKSRHEKSIEKFLLSLLK